MNRSLRLDGEQLTMRPIEAADVERLARMFDRLSPATVYFRFLAPIPRLPRATLLRLADVDHCHSDALVALEGDDIVAVARYNAVARPSQPGSRDAEIALTVEDSWQRRGVGRRLVRTLGVLAARRGFDAFVATIHPDNRAALAMVHQLVPHAVVRFSSGEYQARLPLTNPRPAAMWASSGGDRGFE